MSLNVSMSLITNLSESMSANMIVNRAIDNSQEVHVTREKRVHTR